MSLRTSRAEARRLPERTRKSRLLLLLSPQPVSRPSAWFGQWPYSRDCCCRRFASFFNSGARAAVPFLRLCKRWAELQDGAEPRIPPCIHYIGHTDELFFGPFPNEISRIGEIPVAVPPAALRPIRTIRPPATRVRTAPYDR
jgi:hypothetical protein